MPNYSDKTISIGMTTAAVIVQPVLTENTHADVCVAGVGIAWMSSALTNVGKIIGGRAE